MYCCGLEALPHWAGLCRYWCCLQSYCAFPGLRGSGLWFSSPKSCLPFYVFWFFSQWNTESQHDPQWSGCTFDRYSLRSLLLLLLPQKISCDILGWCVPDLLNAGMDQLLCVRTLSMRPDLLVFSADLLTLGHFVSWIMTGSGMHPHLTLNTPIPTIGKLLQLESFWSQRMEDST